MSERLFKNVGSGLLAQGWTVLLGFFALPILIRGLGAEQYGLLALSLALIGFAAIADLGVGRAASKFIAEDFERGEIERTQKFVKTALSVSVVMGLVGTIALLVLTPVLVQHVFNIRIAIQKEAQFVFGLTAIGLLPVLLRILFDGVLAGHHRIAFLSFTNMIANTLKVGLSVAAILAGYSVLAIVTVNVAVCCLHAVGLGFYTVRFFGGRLQISFGWENRIARQLLQLGLVSTISWTLANVVFLYADRFIIGVFLPLALVGYYNMAFDIVSKQWYVSSSVSQAFFPVFSGKSVTSQAALERSYLQATKTLAVAVTGATMFLVVFGRELLAYWISPEVAANGTTTLMVLAVGILLSCYVTIPYTAIIAGSAKPLICVKIFGVALLIHVFASLWWLRIWGIVGVAFAFVAAYAFVFVASLWWVSRNLVRVPLTRVLLSCFAVPWVTAALWAIACWFLFKPVTHSLVIVGLVLCISYFAYLGVCVLGAYNKEERRQAKNTAFSVLGLRPTRVLATVTEGD
jgi:O-antigen/teichoic acid export membrane protein